jgi:RHS repeat-associated protein
VSNPLVAQRQDSTTWHSGINLLDDAAGVYDGVQSGSWVDGGIAAVGAGLDLLTMAMNPVGTLISYGLNWLIEHVKPLQDALNKLAGDADQIAAYSQTWKNIAQAVGQSAKDLSATVQKDTANWTGQAADTYRANIADKVNHINAAATCSEAIGAVVQVVGVLTGAVRGLVRDMITQAVGDFIQDALEEVCSLGLGTPVVVAQVVEQVAQWMEKIGAVIKKLINSVEKLRPLMSKLEEIFAAIKKVMSELHGRPGEAEPHASAGEGRTHASAGDDVPGETRTPNGDGTTPGGADEPGGAVDGDPGSSTTDPATSSGETSPSRPDNPAETSTPEDWRPCENDPIDVSSGDMVLGQTDLDLAGVLPLVLRRTHVSSYRAGTLFGRSWASTLGQRLEFDARGVVYATEDGMLLVYPHPPVDGEVMPDHGPRWPLSRTGTGFAIRRPDIGSAVEFTGGGAVVPLSAITDRNGNRVDFAHDQAGIVTAIRHSGGYELDVSTKDGLVVALGLRTASAEPVPIVRFGYDSRRDLVAVTNSSGLPLRFEYDASGRITQWTDRNGEWYRYLYDARGRCIANVGSGGFLNGTFDYDTDERVTRFTNALGHTTVYRLNAANQVAARTDPLGTTTTQEWDAQGRLLSRTDPLGRTTRYTYDDAGNLVTVTRPDGSQALAEYNGAGQPTVLVDPDGAVWRQSYDERGNLVSVVDPAGAIRRYSYNDRGHLVETVDAAGGVRRVTIDGAGLPVAVTDPLGARIEYVRDEFGRIGEVIDPLGGRTRFRWTVEGKLLSRTEPNGGVERWRYDAEGNGVEYVDARSNTTRTKRTHFDLPLTETRPDGSRFGFTYDADLRLTAVTNAVGAVWHYEYDDAGRVITETDFTGRRLSYTYDAAGQLIERVNGAGEVTRFTRDALGRAVRRENTAGAATFEFDPAGRLVRAVNAAADVVIRRDPLGRVLDESVNGRVLAFAYDAAGRRVSRRTPGGSRSEWKYDANHRPVRLSSGGRVVRFGYDPAGNEVERLVGTGTRITQTWDPGNRLASQTVAAVAEQARVLQRRNYRYYADGRVSGLDDLLTGARRFAVDALGRVTSVQGTGPSLAESYRYGLAGAVASASWTGSDAVAAGPREYQGTLVRAAGNVQYGHDAQGRMIWRQKKRLSRKPENWRYDWDADDRLVGVVTPDGARWRYLYDALGRRIAKQRLAADGRVLEQTDFCWDGTVLAEQVTPDRKATSWDWAPGSFRPITQVSRTLSGRPQEWFDEQFFSIVTDLVGSPAELLDAAGNVAWYSRTTLWGAPSTVHSGHVDVPLRFPGQYHDPESGLNYNFQRHYDPETARYASHDPLGLAPSADSQSYVANPLTLLDPWGLAACNVYKSTRQEALDAAYDRAGIPRGTEPDAVWEVGNDHARRGQPYYRHSEDLGTHGRYMQFETENGSRVIAEHTSDPRAPGPHFHAGQSKVDPTRDGVDFGWSNKPNDHPDVERYSAIGGSHHIFYGVTPPP